MPVSLNLSFSYFTQCMIIFSVSSTPTSPSPRPSPSCRGSAISKIIGYNVLKSPLFQREVSMWVFEEMVNGRKLSEIINTDHENVKYLPGITLPDNVVSTLLHTKVLAYLPTYVQHVRLAFLWRSNLCKCAVCH